MVGPYLPVLPYFAPLKPLRWGFPHSSVSKESACNTGDPGSVSGLGRSSGERNENPLQYSCLEKPMNRQAWQATVYGFTRIRHDSNWTTTKPLRYHVYCVYLTLISILDSVHTACGKGPKWFVKTGSELLWVLRLLLLLSCSVLSDSLWLDGLQPARLPWSSLAQRVCSNSCPLSQWCHLTISSSATPFSFCLQSFPASGSFPMSQLFASGGQCIGVSASA